MSRIGKKSISVPQGTTITVNGKEVLVKGPKGELKLHLLPHINIQVEGEEVAVTRNNEERQVRANHGLIRSLLSNQIKGVTEGYRKTLKLVGTGYRVALQGKNLNLSLGFSHPVKVEPLNGATLTIEGNDTIHIDGVDKQVVGQMAANIRSLRSPEPYKGKGIRYSDEVVKTKPGKAAAK